MSNIDSLLARRLRGELPRIKILDDYFLVDGGQKMLFHESDPDITINLEGMSLKADGETYLCLYDPQTKQVVILEETTTKLPANTVMLEIATELKLDPIGVAWAYGLNDTFLLDHYPLQDNLEATVIALSETSVAFHLAANRTKTINKDDPGMGITK